MNVQSMVDQADRLVEELRHQAHDYLNSDLETEELAAGELWEKASPSLEKALAIYERKESPETPESSWIPGRTTKKSCQDDLDEILGSLLAVLGACGAAGYRAQIRNLQAANTTSQSRIVKYREQMLSAPAERSQNFFEGMVLASRENLRDSIADETGRVAGRNQQIESLKAGFREHLQHIGVHVSPETADSLLLPLEDDIVSIAAVISNIGRVTEQLQQLVESSREAPAETKRYYGLYLLLVMAVDRVQTHFIQEIDGRFLPKIGSNEEEASRLIADAQSQIKCGGPKDALQANIAAHRRTIEACGLLREMLHGQRRMVMDENRKVQTLIAAAVNTYRTVCLSINMVEMIGYCQAAFRALRELQLPPLRPFQNVQLNAELQNLAERVAAKE